MRWWGITRFLRAPQTGFPGTTAFTGPTAVLDAAVFNEHLFRLSVMQNVRFAFDFQQAATGGAATTLTHPEPGAGLIHIPVAWQIIYDGAVNIAVDLQFAATTSPLDPWGRWSSVNVAWGSCRVVVNRPATPQAPPYMRGMQLRASFPAPAGATNVSSGLIFIEVPAECCTLDTWRGAGQNYVHNSPMP